MTNMNLGVQPLEKIMTDCSLINHDLVAASTEQLTHKEVGKGRKGRRLSKNLQAKILRALITKTGKKYDLGQLFEYQGR